jgi:hypothetical protein
MDEYVNNCVTRPKKEKVEDILELNKSKACENCTSLTRKKCSGVDAWRKRGLWEFQKVLLLGSVLLSSSSLHRILFLYGSELFVQGIPTTSE